MGSDMADLSYRPDIDGMRALAVSAVVVFHAFPAMCPGGFTGVDVFFVISGFLITGILLRRLDAGKHSTADFYEKRIRRIFPALFLMLVVVGAACLALQMPADLRRLGDSVTATAVFSSNVLFWLKTDYFEPAAEQHPLLHMWSLAVEEQFYLIYPLLIAALHGRGRKTLTGALGVGVALSLAASVLLTRSHPAAAFYLPHTRAWELLAGAVVAAAGLRGPERGPGAELLPGAALAAILAGFWWIDDLTPFPGYAALLPVGGTAALLAAGGSGAVGRLLASGPMVQLGRLSYSWYLWHWPLLVLVRYVWIGSPPPPAALGGAVAGSLILAWAAWRWVEQPARTAPASRARVLAVGMAATAAFALAGFGLRQSGGLPGRFGPAVLALAAGETDQAPRACPLAPVTANLTDARCRIGAPNAAPELIVWGDSHAGSVAPAVGDAAARAGIGGVVRSRGECPPLLRAGSTDPGARECLARNRAFIDHPADGGPRTVLVAASWSTTSARLGLPEGALADAIAEVVVALRATGRDVILVQDVPGSPVHVPSALARAAAWGVSVRSTWTRAELEARQGSAIAAVRDVGETLGVCVVRPADSLCESGVCEVVADGRPLYVDDDHLSLAGARRVSPAFDACLAGRGAPDPL